MSARSPARCLALLAALALLACGGPAAERPTNVLWIVWDTVRADRLSLYGHPRTTTPNLDRRAASGRVYDCTSTSAWTLPAHASMFTGLAPSEHGVNAHDDLLAESHETVAEVLGGRGYRTYLFSANPFVSSSSGLAQGFDVEEHPHDPELAERARALVASKLEPGDRSHPLREILAANPRRWSLKAVAGLVTDRFFEFLEADDASRPFFAFLNYMEAHRIRVPPRALRERILEPAQVSRSFEFDQTQRRMQRATFGLAPGFSPEEVEIIRGIYDATLLELDHELERLFGRLERDGLLENTVVVLVSDHGEHLGDHGSFLHQYSLYEGLVRVPLVVWAPGRLAPGREPNPVSNADLFAGVLELAGVAVPGRRGAASLLEPRADRALVSEYLEPYAPLLRTMKEQHPSWDASRFERSLRALRVGRHKYLAASDGTVELFDVSADPGERANLAGSRPELLASFQARLRGWREAVGEPAEAARRSISREEEERLRALGYF